MGARRFPWRPDRIRLIDALGFPLAVCYSYRKTTRGGHIVLVDQSKKQTFSVLSGFRGVARHLKSQWTIEVNTDTFDKGSFDDVRVVIIPQPRATFSANEIEALHGFIDAGGGVLLLLGDGGDTVSNVHAITEKYGIAVNNDCVIRTIYYKYFDPKEALVSNGVVNRSIAVAAKKAISGEQRGNSQTLTFVYPFGCTLQVERTSTVVLSTGSACFPVSRPIAAFHEAQGKDPSQSNGRLVVVGSSSMFGDGYIDKEENSKIFMALIEYLTTGFELNNIDATEPELNQYIYIPDLVHLSEQLKVCMFEGDLNGVISSDFMRIFDTSISSFDLKMWPRVLRAYEELHVPAEPLSLIVPQFEVPLPPLEPAVFPPNFKELQPPQMELFDLDEQFSSAERRLSQLANKCEENDIEYFVREAGEITGISAELPNAEKNARGILEHVIAKLFLFKTSGHEAHELAASGMYDVGGNGVGFDDDDVGSLHNDAGDFHSRDMEEQLFSDMDEFDDL